MKKSDERALPFPWFFQYSALSGKPLMKTKLLCLCFQYRLTWCRNKCLGVLIKCNGDKVVASTFFFLKALSGFFRFLKQNIKIDLVSMVILGNKVRIIFILQHVFIVFYFKLGHFLFSGFFKEWYFKSL